MKLFHSENNTNGKVKSLEKKERSRRPTPPFITSRLQQEAARKLSDAFANNSDIVIKLRTAIDDLSNMQVPIVKNVKPYYRQKEKW